MKLQKLEDSQTSVYLLPDYVKNNGSKLRFTGAEYEREVILEVTMKYKDIELVLKEPKTINIYSLMVEKHAGGEIKEEMEIFLGTKKSNIKKSVNLIKKHDIAFEHIETILEDEFNMPCIKCYDKLIEIKAYEIIDTYLKNNKYVNNIINKSKITIKKEFKDSIQLF